MRHAQLFSGTGFFNALFEHKLTKEEIKKRSSEADLWYAELNIEYEELVDFSQNFNSSFATDNNECYNTAALFMRRMKKVIDVSRKEAAKFHVKENNKYHRFRRIGKKETSVFDRSWTKYYNFEPSLFHDFEDYDDDGVKELFYKLTKCYKLLADTLRLCLEQIYEEICIKADPKICLEIYNNSSRAIDQENAAFVDALKQNPRIIECELSKILRQCSSMEEFARCTFHQFPTPEFRLHRAIEVAGIFDTCTEEELNLFNKDYALIMDVRIVIDHFDEIAEPGRNDTKTNVRKLDPAAILRLKEYIEERIGNETIIEDKAFLKYFESRYKGEYHMIAQSTFSGTKWKENASKKKIFMTKLKSRISKNSDSRKTNFQNSYQNRIAAS